MINIEELQERKHGIIKELEEIQTLRRGTLREQYLKVSRKEKEPSLKGPYYVLARNEKGKTVSIRINNKDELELIKKDVEAYKRFMMLSKEFIAVMEAITDISRVGSIKDSKKNKKCTKKNTIAK